MVRFEAPKAISPVEAMEKPEECNYFTDLELIKSRGSVVCFTCENFTYTCVKYGVASLTCQLHQLLIPEGEHLTKSCINSQRVLDIGLCPEIA